MRLYPVKTPFIIANAFSSYTWFRKNDQREVYLTFDDGPTKELTKQILSILDRYGVKATFFCVGENLDNHRDEAITLLQTGHRIGNHTFNHLNGWKTMNDEYLMNADKCQDTLKGLGIETNLFRPPYGKITKKQGKDLIRKGFEIVMWDVLSGDFDQSMSLEKCLKLSVQNTEPGSIIVFHDNIKSQEKIEFVLPRYIEDLLAKDYNFALL